jgi:hypothetical protein
MACGPCKSDTKITSDSGRAAPCLDSTRAWFIPCSDSSTFYSLYSIRRIACVPCIRYVMSFTQESEVGLHGVGKDTYHSRRWSGWGGGTYRSYKKHGSLSLYDSSASRQFITNQDSGLCSGLITQNTTENCVITRTKRDCTSAECVFN